MKINRVPQSNLENSFPIILENNKDFKDNYTSMLRFLVINELYLEAIEDLEERKSMFKFEFKKQANIMKAESLKVGSKFFKGKDLLNDYDKLNQKVTDRIRKILNTIIIK